jgi:uncharacterized protein
MDIEFDAAKDKANREKHSVSLGEAAQLDWDAALVAPDTRHEYGEHREIGYAPMGARLYCVVFVRRGEVFRIISLRKANDREVEAYEKGQTN